MLGFHECIPLEGLFNKFCLFRRWFFLSDLQWAGCKAVLQEHRYRLVGRKANS